jgi:hypothetical protein
MPFAMPSPIPPLPPVTIATRPVKSNSFTRRAPLQRARSARRPWFRGRRA